jgi:hypothetical protein
VSRNVRIRACCVILWLLLPAVCAPVLPHCSPSCRIIPKLHLTRRLPRRHISSVSFACPSATPPTIPSLSCISHERTPLSSICTLQRLQTTPRGGPSRAAGSGRGWPSRGESRLSRGTLFARLLEPYPRIVPYPHRIIDLRETRCSPTCLLPVLINVSLLSHTSQHDRPGWPPPPHSMNDVATGCGTTSSAYYFSHRPPHHSPLALYRIEPSVLSSWHPSHLVTLFPPSRREINVGARWSRAILNTDMTENVVVSRLEL